MVFHALGFVRTFFAHERFSIFGLGRRRGVDVAGGERLGGGGVWRGHCW